MSNAEPSVVRFVDVSKSFGALQVFDRLQLEVREREVLTLLGGSGAGKSVLLKLLLGLLPFDSGSVFIDGEDISNYDEAAMLPVRRKVGMLFQNGALFDSLSVRENVAYPLRERGERDEQHITSRVAEVLEMVGLPGTERKMPAELSGGMRKRVALARAVVQAPKVVLYDEPTTGLDPINVRRISELILDLNQRLHVTSICVTHDLASAFMVSDRLAMIAQKRVIEVAPTAELRRSENPLVQQFLTAMDPRSTAHTARAR